MTVLGKVKCWSRDLVICGVVAFGLYQAVDFAEALMLEHQMSIQQELQNCLENQGCKVNLELDGLFNKERTVRYTYTYRNNSGKDIKNLKGHFVIFGVNGSKNLESESFSITNLHQGATDSLEHTTDIEQSSHGELFKKDLPIIAEKISAERTDGILDSVGGWFRSKFALFEQKAETISYDARFVVDEIEYADGKVLRQNDSLWEAFINFFSRF